MYIYILNFGFDGLYARFSRKKSWIKDRLLEPFLLFKLALILLHVYLVQESKIKLELLYQFFIFRFCHILLVLDLNTCLKTTCIPK